MLFLIVTDTFVGNDGPFWQHVNPSPLCTFEQIRDQCFTVQSTSGVILNISCASQVIIQSHHAITSKQSCSSFVMLHVFVDISNFVFVDSSEILVTTTVGCEIETRTHKEITCCARFNTK